MRETDNGGDVVLWCVVLVFVVLVFFGTVLGNALGWW